jgi:protein-tyrosine phosphatase
MEGSMKIMFVCLGNICRSPLAEAVFVHKVKERGLDFAGDSSGTSAYHIGDAADPRMREVARKHGVPIKHRAQQFQPRHFNEFDLVLAMDESNFSDLLTIAKSDEERNKIVMFRDFDPEGHGDVPDPYYGGKEGFEQVYAMVDRTCDALIEKFS